VPTGITAPIYDGREGFGLREYLLRVSGLLGVHFITTRTQGLDVELPTHYEPNTYHKNALATAEARIVELKAMSVEQAADCAEGEFDQALAAWEADKRERDARGARFRQMLRDLDRWTCPKEYEAVKEVATKQLTDELKFSGYNEEEQNRYYSKPVLLTGEEWLKEQLRRALKDCEYHAEQYAKDLERVRENNEWLDGFLATLPPQ
jgi:hypothetical protein